MADDAEDVPPPPAVDELSEVLDLDEAAALLRVKKRTLSDLANEGKVPARKIGRAWRFSRPELHRWLGHR